MRRLGFQKLLDIVGTRFGELWAQEEVVRWAL